MKTAILTTLALSGALLALPGLALAQDAETAEAKKYELKLGVEKGARLAYETSGKTTTNVSGQMPMEITNEEKSTVTYEVTAVAKDGTVKLKTTYDHISGGFNHPMMGETKWDSADPTVQSNPLSKAVTALASKSVNASISSDGKFTAVEGTTEALGETAQALEANPQLAPLKRSLSDSGQLQSLQRHHVPLPKEAVAVGGTWTDTRSVDVDAWTFEMSYTYELEKVEGDIAHIRVKGEGKLTETREMQPGMPPPETTVNSCLTKGTAQVSITDGMPREVALTDSYDMVMAMMGMEFPMVISTSRFSKSVEPSDAAAEEGTDAGVPSPSVPSPDAPAPK